MLDDDGINQLRIAIVKDAADVYVSNKKLILEERRKNESELTYHARIATYKDKLDEVKRFFLSPWFELLYGDISGAEIIRQLDIRAKRELDERESRNTKKSNRMRNRTEAAGLRQPGGQFYDHQQTVEHISGHADQSGRCSDDDVPVECGANRNGAGDPD